MPTETNTIDTLTMLSRVHWNDTTVKVSNRNKAIVESIEDHNRVKTGDKVVAFFPYLQYNEFKIIGIHYKSETVTIANTKGFIQSYNVSFEKLERDFKESFTEKPIKIKGAD